MTSQLPAETSAVREEVDRIRCSRAFRDRDTMQHLLDYLVQRTLDGTADNLKEYVIGVDVFAKPQGYDPQTDPSVRVQIGRLRKKLEEYYHDEGASDPLILQVPKRQFGIAIEPRTTGSAPVSSPRRSKLLPLLHAALTIVLAIAVIVLLVRSKTPAASALSPEEAALWHPFTDGSRPVVMSLGTLLFYQWPGGMIRDPELDRLTEAERQPRLDELQRMLHSPEPLKRDLIYTGVGQATAIFLLTEEFDRLKVPLDLVRSNALGWDDIAKHNVIFVGSAKVNSQLREIPVNWAFRVDGANIVNLHPRPGEAASYGPECSLISLFPGLHGQGEILIVESGSGTGAWAGAKYLTDPAYVKEMVAHLRQPDGRLPRHYQVVLKSQIAGEVPIQIQYVTHRIL